VEPLIAALKGEDERIVCPAIIYLSNIGDAMAVESLLEALKHEKAAIRQAAADALSKVGDARAVEPLMAVLKDNHHSKMNILQSVGGIAKSSLVKIGVPAIEPLLSILEDMSKDMRGDAAFILGAIGDVRAVEPLHSTLKDENRGVRTEAAIALGSLGDTKAVEPILASMKEMSFGMKIMVTKALEQLGWQPGNDEDGARYWIGMEKFEKCIEIGTFAVMPLIAALDNKNSNTRKGAAFALGKIGDDRAVKPLQAMLKDKDKSLRRSATEALKLLGVQPEKEKEVVQYSEKGLKSKVLFSQLPQLRKTCPECRIQRRVQSELEIIGETDIPGALKLECPVCGQKTVFLPN